MEERGMNARVKKLRKLSLDTPAHIDLERAVSETETYKKIRGRIVHTRIKRAGTERLFFYKNLVYW